MSRHFKMTVINGHLEQKVIIKLNINNHLVIAVRVTKPRIPENIRANYESMESEKTKYLIGIEKAKILEKDAETNRIQSIIKAKADAEVSKIVKEKEINEHE